MAKIGRLVSLFLVLVALANMVGAFFTKNSVALWEGAALLLAASVMAFLFDSWKRYHKSRR